MSDDLPDGADGGGQQTLHAFGGGASPSRSDREMAHETRSDRARHRRKLYDKGRCEAMSTSKGCRCGGGVVTEADGIGLCQYHQHSHQPITIESDPGRLARWCGTRRTEWDEIPEAVREALLTIDQTADTYMSENTADSDPDTSGDRTDQPTIDVSVGHCKRDETDVYIGRGPGGRSMHGTAIGDRGWLGNPFPVEDCEDRAASIRKFKRNFEHRLLADEAFRDAVATLPTDATLGCWCRSVDEDEPACHGDVIAAAITTLTQSEGGAYGG